MLIEPRDWKVLSEGQKGKKVSLEGFTTTQQVLVDIQFWEHLAVPGCIHLPVYKRFNRNVFKSLKSKSFPYPTQAGKWVIDGRAAQLPRHSGQSRQPV